MHRLVHRSHFRNVNMTPRRNIAANSVQLMALSLGLALCSGAWAQSLPNAAAANPLQIRNWAAACTLCHGGAGPDQEGIRPLAGLPVDELLQKLADFRSGKKTGTVMPQIATGYSTEQLQALAGYFAAQPPKALPVPVDANLATASPVTRSTLAPTTVQTAPAALAQ
jgi:cytochrome c553